MKATSSYCMSLLIVVSLFIFGDRSSMWHSLTKICASANNRQEFQIPKKVNRKITLPSAANPNPKTFPFSLCQPEIDEVVFSPSADVVFHCTIGAIPNDFFDSSILSLHRYNPLRLLERRDARFGVHKSQSGRCK